MLKSEGETGACHFPARNDAGPAAGWQGCAGGGAPQSQRLRMSFAARQLLPAPERQAHTPAVWASIPFMRALQPAGTGWHAMAVLPVSRTQAYGALVFAPAQKHSMRGSTGPWARSTQ